MKIGIFTDAYHPVCSGVVTSIKTLEKEMIKRGHEVFIFAPSKTEPTENQNLYMLKSMPLFVAKQYKHRIAAFYSRSIAKEIKELNLDIVHTQDEFSLGLFGKIIARKYKIPFIHTYHTMWEDYLHYLIPIKGSRMIYPKRFARAFTRRFASKAECLIAPSKKTEKYLRYRCKIKKPIYVIPTGIDIAPFNPKNFTDEQKNELRKSLGIKPDDKVILFIGRIGEEKSIDVLMNNMPEVFDKIPNAKFLIVGDGPSLTALQEQAKKLGISNKVIFAGRQPWEKIALYYNIGDVFVNASVTETQGLTFIEAMASGLPLVAKYAPNLSEFIHNSENGVLLKGDNHIGKEIVHVLTDDEFRNKLIENAHITAQNHSSKEFGDKIENLYAKVINDYHKKLVDKEVEEELLGHISNDEFGNVEESKIGIARKIINFITK